VPRSALRAPPPSDASLFGLFLYRSPSPSAIPLTVSHPYCVLSCIFPPSPPPCLITLRGLLLKALALRLPCVVQETGKNLTDPLPPALIMRDPGHPPRGKSTHPFLPLPYPSLSGLRRDTCQACDAYWRQVSLPYAQPSLSRTAHLHHSRVILGEPIISSLFSDLPFCTQAYPLSHHRPCTPPPPILPPSEPKNVQLYRYFNDVPWSPSLFDPDPPSRPNQKRRFPSPRKIQ